MSSIYTRKGFSINSSQSGTTVKLTLDNITISYSSKLGIKDALEGFDKRVKYNSEVLKELSSQWKEVLECQS